MKPVLQKTYLSLLFIMVSFYVVAQSEYVSTPSASAASSVKSGDIPVNYNNGTSQISIPITTISEYDLNLPVYLSYQTGGLGVSEISSAVGSGWHLQYGGTITRSVRGMPDDMVPQDENDPVGYLYLNEDPNEYQYHTLKDITPDIYYFNVLGYSGSFTLQGSDTIVFKHQSNVKISHIEADGRKLGYWKIVLPNGFVCYLGKYDGRDGTDAIRSYNRDQLNSHLDWENLCGLMTPPSLIHLSKKCKPIEKIYTSWNLIEIVSPQGHSIELSYDLERYVEHTLQEIRIPVSSPCNVDLDYDPNERIQFHETYAYRIKEISSPHYRVLFGYQNDRQDLAVDKAYFIFDNIPLVPIPKAKALSSIEIQAKSQSAWTCLKQFSLEQSYAQAAGNGFGGQTDWLSGVQSSDYPDRKRMFLDHIVEKPCGAGSGYETEFSYYGLDSLSRRLSHSQDYWGFHNGQYDNLSLIPRTVYYGDCLPNVDCRLSSWAKFADRESNFAFARAGTLKEIRYPTGAKSSFVYEGNDVRAKEFIYIGETGGDDPLKFCSLDGNDCFDCDGLPNVSEKEISDVEYSNISIYKFVVRAKLESCLNQTAEVRIYSRNSNNSNYGQPKIQFTVQGVYNDWYEGEFDLLLTNSQILDIFEWEDGESYDILVQVDEGIREVYAALIVDQYEPSLINKPVGGIRIKRLASGSITKEYDYTALEDIPQVSGSSNLVDFVLCNTNQCPGESIPTPGGGSNCNNKKVDNTINIHLPCDGDITLTLHYAQTNGCNQGYMHISFAWQQSYPIYGEWDSILYTTLNTTGTEDYLKDDLISLGLIPGFNYNFRFRIIDDYVGVATAKLKHTPDDTEYAPIGNYISAGELTMPPFQLTYAGSFPQGLFYEDECYEGDLFFLSTSPQSRFQSTAGGIILYTRVNELIYGNGQYYGRNVYLFNNARRPGFEPVENRFSSINPVVGSHPGPSEFLKPPTYGLLEQIETYDSEEKLERKESYEYLVFDQRFSTNFSDTWVRCNQTLKVFSPQYYSPNYVVLPSAIKKDELGIETITRHKYREDRIHLNPIRTTTHVTGHWDTLVVEMLYAEELANLVLLERNMVSIPIEVSNDQGKGGGSKTEFTIENGRVLPYKFSRQLDDGTWKTTKEVTEFTTDGLPEEVWNLSAGGITYYDWEDGLLIESRFGDRISEYTYEPTRLISGMVSFQGIESSYIYDPYLRLETATTNNGRNVSTYRYLVFSTDGENKVITVSSFPNDPYGLPDWETHEVVDIDGLSSFVTRKNYTYKGNDYTTGIQYGALGETLLSCDPNKGGCDVYEYTLSPLRRLVNVIPAGSPKPILHHTWANDIAVSMGDDIFYPPNTLIKTSKTDENGVIIDQYTNMRGNTVMTSRDPKGLNLRTYYNYNNRGDLLEVYPPGSGGDNDDVNFIYTYTVDGLLATKYIPDEGLYTYTPNAREAISTIVKPNGFTTEFVYHGTYPEIITEVKENGTTTKSITPYDGDFVKGWIGTSSLLTGGHMLSTTYDARDDLGQIVSETREYIDGNSEFTYSYDHAGNVRTSNRIHTGPDPFKSISYAYEYEMPKGIRTDEVKLNLGGIQSLSRLEYDDNDWLQTSRVGDGIHTLSYDYNPRGWLQEINGAEPPPPAPKDDCELIEPSDPDPFPIPFPNCVRSGGMIQVRILYNCDRMRSGDSTTIFVRYIGETTQSFIIPLNGSTGYTEVYPDSYSFVFQSENIAELEAILRGLFSDCISTELGDLYHTTQLDQIINQILDQIDDEEENGPLFGIKLHYFDPNGSLEAPAQYNGNISWMEWQVAGEHYQAYGFQYDAANRLTQGKYEARTTRCKKTPAAYDVSYGYDNRGNITQLSRRGFLGINTEGDPLYGHIDQLSYGYTGANQLEYVEESENMEKGYRGSQSVYIYDNAGRLILEQGARAAGISYNFLNQPLLIKVGNKDAVRNTWDAGGTLQMQILYDENEAVLHERLYHDGIEYLDGKIQCIHHPEGRYVFEYEKDGSLKRQYHEWMITDHLGNTRVRFADFNGDKEINLHDKGPGQEKELLGSFHYYPYGLKMEGIFHDQEATECRYQYNGIEYISHADLDVSLATWRTHDAAIGRWWQVDPKAEAMYGYSPYNAMGCNPVSFNDPEGDIIPALLVGAAIGVAGNGAMNIMNGDHFFKGAGVSAVFGAIGGGFSSLIGTYAMGMTSQLGAAAFQFGAHGVTAGWLSVMGSGGDMRALPSGFLSGALSSGISSGADALGMGSGVMIGLGALGGGVGSRLGGGSFVKGMVQGLITSSLNHAAHSGLFGEDLAASLITGRVRHMVGADLISGYGNVVGGLGMAIEVESGGVHMLRGREAGQFESYLTLGIGGGVDATIGIGATKYYYGGGINTLSFKNAISGVSTQGSFSIGAFGISAGFSIGRSRLNNFGFRTYMIGVGIGLSPAPIWIGGAVLHSETFLDPYK